jgi:hypothetical protein
LTEQGFRVAEALLQKSGRRAHTKEIAQHVAPGAEGEETTRKAIVAFRKAAVASFREAGVKRPKDLDDFIESSNNGFHRLLVKGYLE